MHFLFFIYLFSTLLKFLSTNDFQFSVTLNEQDSEDSDINQKSLLLTSSLICGPQDCDYSIYVENYANKFFKVLVNSRECPDNKCINSFHKNQVVNVTVHKIATGEYLDVFDFEFLITPKITILGCEAGFYNDGKCTRITEIVHNLDEQTSFFDEVCVCATIHKQYCNKDATDGICKKGIEKWWKGFSSTSKMTTLPQTTTPFHETNVLEDIAISLRESKKEGGETDYKNLIVSAYMNCTAKSCQHKTIISDDTQEYYSVFVGNNECVNRVCSGTLFKDETAPIIIKRSRQQLNLFEYKWIDGKYPSITVLSCELGLSLLDTCLFVNNSHLEDYDNEVCSCQGTKTTCDDYTQNRICIEGTPIWWVDDPSFQSTYSAAITDSTTTLLPQDPNVFNLVFILYEGDLNQHQPGKENNLTINANMNCWEVACQYTVDILGSELISLEVLVNGSICSSPSCINTFSKGQKVAVTLIQNSKQLDLFDFQFYDVPNVAVLGCPYGMLDYGHCIKTISYIDDTNRKNDTLCVCQNSKLQCDETTLHGKCSDGDPVWWKEISFSSTQHSKDTTSTQTTTPSTSVSLSDISVEVTLTEEETYEENKKNLTMEATMKCVEKNCTWIANVMNYSPDYFNVTVGLTECETSCSGILSEGETVKLIVHRLKQHLNLVEFQWIDQPKLLVMGCTDFVQSAARVGEPLITQDDACYRFIQSLSVYPNYYNDDVCICNNPEENCDDKTKLGQCSNGRIIWWEDDESGPSSSSPTTSSTTTSFKKTTESNNPTGKFSYNISLTEGRDNKEHQLIVSSEMICSAEKCGYSINLENSAQTYFRVYVGNELCRNKECAGSFLKNKAVNVTVYRGEQVLDLFDFEYTDAPKIVVLGCEDGLSKYGDCIKTTHIVEVEREEFVDVVCSCQSAQMDCTAGTIGVCKQGQPKWWRNLLGSSTTGFVQTSSSPTPTTTNNLPSLKDLSNSGVGLNNVTQVLNDTHYYSQLGQNLNRTQIFEITKILHNSANLLGISMKNAIQILQNLDQCLNAHRREIRNGQSKEYSLLAILKPMVQNTKDNIIQYLHGQNLGFNAKKVNCLTENHTDDGLIYYGTDKGYAILNDTNKLSATNANSIIVPLGSLCKNQAVSHVFFTIFRGQKLFSGKQKYRSYGTADTADSGEEADMTELGMTRERDGGQNGSDTIFQVPAPSKCTRQISVPQCPVMSATIMSGNTVIKAFTDKKTETNEENNEDALMPPIAKIQFNVGNIPKPLHGDTIVSWFETTKNEWSLNEQCKVEADSNGLITASCEHLTDFTVLIYGQLNAEYVCSWPLIIIGYSVNGTSLFCLFVLIVVGLMFYIPHNLIERALAYVRGQAQTNGDIINLAYYCIFFIFFILTLFFMDQSTEDQLPVTTSTYCVVIAAVSYFSLISAIMMSMLIGIRMVCHFFSPKLRSFFETMTSPPAALSIGLIIPFTLTLFLAIFDTSFFERNDSFCWVRPDYIIYAVVIPVVLPIINGLLCSTFAIYKMFFQTKRGLASKEITHYDAEFWTKVVGILIMQVAMGLPWGIEFILIGVSGPSPWNYIFVILLGTQGIDLFLIFLYRRQRLVNESKKWSVRTGTIEKKHRSKRKSGGN